MTKLLLLLTITLLRGSGQSNTVSASGEATFRCLYSKKWEFQFPD